MTAPSLPERLDAKAAELQAQSAELGRVAWSRTDGGQEWSLAAVAMDQVDTLLTQAAERIRELEGVAALARELVTTGMVNRGVDRGLVVVEKADKSDPHYRLCKALDRLHHEGGSLQSSDQGSLRPDGLRPVECVDVWRPIETAPKDGTRILLAGGGLQQINVGGWCERVGAWDCEAEGMFEDGPSWGGGEEDGPTHWMPLPAPPTGEAESGSDPKQGSTPATVASPPAGYYPLSPKGLACKCIHSWTDGQGQYWCCNHAYRDYPSPREQGEG